MKRSNGILLGTILVFLIGVVLFMQTASDPFAGQSQPGHHQEEPEQQATENESGTLSPGSIKGEKNAVTADDLANTMTDPAANQQGRAIPATPHKEKFQGVNTESAEPTSRWYDPNRKAGDSK
ncbi:MAG: hypothetical protein AB1725_04785 [Armatimonadota bacterium]